MTERDIIIDWLMQKRNTDKLMTVAYAEPLYEFIISGNVSSVRNDNGTFYKLGDDWYKVIKIQPQPTNPLI